MLAVPLSGGIVASMKRSGACSLQADEPRVPRVNCSFPHVERVSCVTRPHPVPLLQERENCSPHDQYSNDWDCSTRLVTTGDGGELFPLLGERVRVRAGHEKTEWQVPANRSRKSLISTIVSDSSRSIPFFHSRILSILFILSRCSITQARADQARAGEPGMIERHGLAFAGDFLQWHRLGALAAGRDHDAKFPAVDQP